MADRPSAGRLFVAVPLTESVRRDLVAHLQRSLARRGLPGRVVPPENWHFTLRFLGDASRDALDHVTAGLAAAELGAPFTLRFQGLGAFPRPARARVIWLGAGAGRDSLARLAAVVDEVVVGAGFEPERRRFSAHLTLSRLRPERDVTRVLAAVPALPVQLPVDRVVVYRSHLSRAGARYEVVRRFALRSSATD